MRVSKHNNAVNSVLDAMIAKQFPQEAEQPTPTPPPAPTPKKKLQLPEGQIFGNKIAKANKSGFTEGANSKNKTSQISERSLDDMLKRLGK